MNLSELSRELAQAQAEYEQKAMELNDAAGAKENAEIALIRADSAYKRLRLEVTVAKSKVDTLKDASYNLRAESRL